jgi:hypothetical protein
VRRYQQGIDEQRNREIGRQDRAKEESKGRFGKHRGKKAGHTKNTEFNNGCQE